jgi:HAD superfamily hydrolase (TIGR01509 family)
MVKTGLNLSTFDAILVDVGNVIFYDFTVELAYSYYAYEEIIERRPKLRVTAEEILWASKKSPERLAWKLGSTRSWAEINYIAWGRVLDVWDSLCVPIPGSIETLYQLSHLRLAIVANQPLETMRVLEQMGIAKLFEEIIFDSAVGVSKPSLILYRYAARRLRARPDSLVMIGDRLDNDILPAKSLGMTTVWVNNFPLDDTIAVPHVPVYWKNHYFEFRARVSTQHFGNLPEVLPTVRPDIVVGCLVDLTD